MPSFDKNNNFQVSRGSSRVAESRLYKSQSTKFESGNKEIQMSPQQHKVQDFFKGVVQISNESKILNQMEKRDLNCNMH